MAARPTWRDYYETLTANSRVASRTNAQNPQNLYNFTYGQSVGGSGAGTPNMTRAGLSAPPRSNFQNKAAVAAQVLPFIGNYLAQMIADPEPETTPAGRVLDVMSRGMYASQGAQKSYYEQDPGDDYHAPDLPKMAAAAWEGFLGHTKNTAHDVAEVRGFENEGKAAFARNFISDVVTDPTSYIGVGLIRSAGEALGKTAGSEAAVGAAKIAKKVTRRPINDLAEAVTDVGDDAVGIPSKDFGGFLDRLNVNRNQENPGSGIFDNVVDQEGKPITASPSFRGAAPRTFIGDAGGTIGERYQLPGPTPEVITGRAGLNKVSDMSRNVAQFEYGRDVDEISPTGWFREDVRQVPITPDDTPSGYVPNPNSSAAMERQAIRDKFKFLDDAGNPDLETVKSPVVRTIMSRVDEPVFASYEPHTLEFHNEKGILQKVQVWRPNPEAIADNDMMYMGDLRAKLANPATTPVERSRLTSMLVNHIKAVESYARSAPAGFKGESGYQNFYREMYGASPREAKKAMGKSTIPDLPPAPSMPTFKEVREWVKLPWQEKMVLQHSLSGILKPEHLAYLSRASNHKSYATRLKNIQHMSRETRDAEDLIEAINRGAIQTIEQPGIPELLEHYNVKTLKQLAKAIQKDIDTLSAAEKKMLGKYAAKDGIAPAEARMRIQSIGGGMKELGPTGNPYKGYPGTARITAMAEEAKAKAAQITPAEHIIEAVKQGDKTALTAPKAVLNESQRQIFNRAAEVAIQKNVFDLRNKDLWKYFTRTGVIRTDKTYNVGKGNVKNAWNIMKQYDFFKAMFADISKSDASIKEAMNAANIRGTDRLRVRADIMYDQFMPVMRGMDDILKQGGVFPVAGLRDTDLPLSMFEAFDSIDPGWIKDNIFTVGRDGSMVAPTQLMNAIETGLMAMRSGKIPGEGVDDLSELIFQELVEVKKTRSGKTIPNGFNKWANSSKVDAGDVEDFLAPIVEALPDMMSKVEKNAAQKILWKQNNQGKATQAALDEIAARLMGPDASISANLELADDIERKIIPKVSRSSTLDEDDAWHVVDNVNAALPEVGMPVGVRAVGARAGQRARATSASAKTAIDIKAMEESTEQAAKILGEEEMRLAEAGTQFENSLTHRMITEIFPHYGNDEIRPLFIEHKSTMQSTARAYQGLLSGISKIHTKPDLLTAWRNLQSGDTGASKAVLDAQKDLNKAIGTIFADNPDFSMFGRNGLTAKELDAHFDHFKINPKFRFGKDDAMHDAWKEWDTEDPLDLLGKVFAASTTALGKKLLGDQLMSEFGSTVKRAGDVKLANRGEEVLRYIDTDNVYFPKEIASQMHILNEFLEKTMKPSTAGPILRTYDKVLHSYKTGLTIYRPGHHVRNMTGDMWLSWMAGVNSPSVYYDGYKVMKAMGKDKYKDFDAIAALVRGAEIPVKPGLSNDIILYTRINGKKVPVRAHEIYRGLFDRGVLNDYRSLDDLQIAGDDVVSNGLMGNFKPFGGKVHQTAATISESRDHLVRIAHAIDILRKGKFKSLDEAFGSASQTVRKWHPDGSDLSHFESTVMRRTLLFYSWLRKAIPLVLEGMVMNPGKAIMYPKAMYDLAESNGIDLDSIGDPFPTDQLFPDWIREGLSGPIAGEANKDYMGISPGIPMMDIMKDFGGGQAESSLAGALTPALKLPMEIFNRPDGGIATDARTDIPFFDLSDYADKQIPNSNLFTGTTGRSLTQPWEAKGGADKEPDTSNQQRTLINFLAGMGLIDMSKPGYIKQAKREQSKR